jgi:hypothetical protein
MKNNMETSSFEKIFTSSELLLRPAAGTPLKQLVP